MEIEDLERAGKLSWRSLSSSVAAFSSPKTRKGTASPLTGESAAAPLRAGPGGLLLGPSVGLLAGGGARPQAR